jgi:cyclically-permuted mutarotase family protein
MKSFVSFFTAAFVLPAFTVAAEVVNLNWDLLPALPPSPGQEKQPGVAGPFAGVHGDALIVAGGANFPDQLPWDGGAKIWWDDVWVLENLSATPRWVTAPATSGAFKLPRRLGYGISVSTPDGVICAGGQDAGRCYADVFMLSWDARTRDLRHTALPSMPEPLSFMAGAVVDNTLYVAGGQTTMQDPQPSMAFWSLDLSKRDRPAGFKWTVLPPWPGPPRILAIAAAQRGRRGSEFFLFSGRSPQAGAATELLSDAYAFDPKTRTWRTLPRIGDGENNGLSVMAGSAAPAGDRDVLLFGGDRGELYRKLEEHDLAIGRVRAQLQNAPADRRKSLEREIATRLDAKRIIYGEHPGFAREVLAFDTQRETWRTVGHSPLPAQVTTVAVTYRDAILIPSGEIKPGIRTPAIVRVVPVLK